MPNDASLDRVRAVEWNDAPVKDELGSAIDRTHAFRVSTREQLAEVLAWAGENKLLVSPGGAFSSSSAFKALPKEWMEKHGKKGIVLVGFDESPKSEFSQISVDTDKMEVSAGAAVNLKHLSDVVDSESRGELENRMTITTMNAKLVATLLGSGGVSDSALSVDSLCTASEFMNGRGKVRSETYIPGDYFDYSSFDMVNPNQLGREMSGRGGPFGIGLNATIKLFERPKKTYKVIYEFSRSIGSVDIIRRSFLDTIVAMNIAAQQKGLALVPRAFEIMDGSAIKMAGDAMNWMPSHITSDPELIIIAEFAQPESGDHDVLDYLLSNGFVPDAYMPFADNIRVVGSCDTHQLETFRLFGPDEIRNIRKRQFPKAPTVSTDFAVAAADSGLTHWYGNEIFELQDKMKNSGAIGVLYGHGFKRFDPHYRVVSPDEKAFAAHEERLADLGNEFVRREMDLRANGIRTMRERGEKPESRDDKVISANRSPAHQAANVKILNEEDPHGLFRHRAKERDIT